MVSARPGPSPAKGRISYPRADAYVPGDEDTSPSFAGVEPTSDNAASAAQAFAAAHSHSPSHSRSNVGSAPGASSPPRATSPLGRMSLSMGSPKGSSKGSRSTSPDPKAVGGLMRNLNLPLTGSALHATPTLPGPGPGGMSYGLGSVQALGDPEASGSDSGSGAGAGAGARNLGVPQGGRGRSPSSPPAMQQAFPRHAALSPGASSPLTVSPGTKPANPALLGHSSIPEEPLSATSTSTSASAPGFAGGAGLGKVKSIQIPVSALFADELARQSSRESGSGGVGKGKGRAGGGGGGLTAGLGGGSGGGGVGKGGVGGYMSEGDNDKDRSQAQGLKSWWKGFIEKTSTGTGAGSNASGAEDDKPKPQKKTSGPGAGAVSSDEPLSSPSAGTASKADPLAASGAGGKKVFGVPLAESIEYASVQVSTVGEDGSLYVWGVIPVVVARCGLYLKETATEVEGAFRISGSAKRMRDLQEVFDTGPRYGKDIKWDELSYTPHDVATIFRRFLTLAPESIIPTHLYEDFALEVKSIEMKAEAKANAQYRAVLASLPTTPSADETAEAIAQYKTLIRSMPAVNQYLLLYVLDLLSVFARKSEINLMTTGNLAMIFQPGVLAHPVHAMRPREHVLSQKVLEFLIENQDEFLVGMELEKPKKRKSKKRTKAEKDKAKATAAAAAAQQKAAQLTKADPDLMPPSDSDDEAPTGGYYVIEGNPKVIAADNRSPDANANSGKVPSIKVPTQTVYSDATGKVSASSSSLARTTSPLSAASTATATSPMNTRTKSPQSATSSGKIPDLPQISAIQLAPPPPKPRVRAGSAGAGGAGGGVAIGTVPGSGSGSGLARSSSSASNRQAPQSSANARSPPDSAAPLASSAAAIQEEMEPSDSDEDMPDGTTYTVHVSDAARAREAKANVKAGHGGGAGTGRRLSLAGGEGKGGVLGLGLGRKRTLGKGDSK